MIIRVFNSYTANAQAFVRAMFPQQDHHVLMWKRWQWCQANYPVNEADRLWQKYVNGFEQERMVNG